MSPAELLAQTGPRTALSLRITLGLSHEAVYESLVHDEFLGLVKVDERENGRHKRWAATAIGRMYFRDLPRETP